MVHFVLGVQRITLERHRQVAPAGPVAAVEVNRETVGVCLAGSDAHVTSNPGSCDQVTAVYLHSRVGLPAGRQGYKCRLEQDDVKTVCYIKSTDRLLFEYRLK